MSWAFNRSSTDATRRFYERLAAGGERRGLWGREKRFDPDLIREKPSVRKHFSQIIEPYLAPDSNCLDLGCGPGGFLSVMAPMCGHIVGVDIVPSFVEECRAVIQRQGYSNATALLNEKLPLPFGHGEFDCIVMVDTIHHLEGVTATLEEVHRVLRPGGMFLIFEPNKLNPLLAAMCVLDPNEWGLLQMGTFAAYHKLLEGRFHIEHEAFNGLLIGPAGRLALFLGNVLSSPRYARSLGWLSPKLFLAARKL